MTLKTPLYMQAGGGDPAITFSGLDYRSFFDALFLSEGVIGLSSLAVTQRGAGANFSVDVAAGWCVITGDDAAQQGKYVQQNTATVNVAIPTPGAGTRIHRVIARIKDKLHAGGTWSTYEWTIEVLADTTGVTPAEPNSAITLALVTVVPAQASVTTADIADKRPSAMMWPTRDHQVGSDAGRPKNPQIGEKLYRTDRGPIGEVWDGFTWRIDGSAGSIYKDRSSDATPKVSTTTLTDDTQLTTSLVASVTYILDAVLIYTADAGGDFKAGVTVPGGCTVNGFCHNLPATQTGALGDETHDQFTEASTPIGGGSGATVMAMHIRAKVWSGSGGTFAIKWAQGTSNINGTVLKQHSHMELRPVGT